MSSQRKEAKTSGEASLNGTNKSNEDEKTTTTTVAAKKTDDEDGEDQWEDLYDEDDESMINKLSELSLANKKKTNSSGKKSDEKSPPKGTKTSTSAATTTTTTAAAGASARPQTQALSAKIIDYLKFEPKAAAASSSSSNQTNQQQQSQSANTNESDDKDEFLRPEYAHMIEIYDFPACFKNENIINALTHGTGVDTFSIKWVDDTHCLGVFSSGAEAQKALKVDNQSVRTRAVHESSEQTRQMAKRKLEQLKPFKARPQTSNLVANRLIGASLGIRLPKEKQDIERNKLKMAKEKSQKDKDLKDSIWNGETA